MVDIWPVLVSTIEYAIWTSAAEHSCRPAIGQDKTIKLWDLFYGRMIKSMTGHTQPIHSLSFSAESSVIISGSSDCTVRVWDAKTMGGKKTGPGIHDTTQT
jgi:WD40 repeat protein